MPFSVKWSDVVGRWQLYRAIPPNLLHVWVKNQPAEDPSNWPLLIDTDIADVVVFD